LTPIDVMDINEIIHWLWSYSEWLAIFVM